MQPQERFKEQVLKVTPDQFEELALELFRYQAAENQVYAAYLKALSVEPSQIQSIESIPFLPIEFFKTHRVITGAQQSKVIFTSSGTTGQQTSQHHVVDPDFYLMLSQQLFEEKYGSLSNYHVLALLPSYLERSGSSLVYMAEHFIQQSKSTYSGFYLHNYQELVNTLRELQKYPTKVLLLGVTFGLLDLIEQAKEIPLLTQLIVMETGGMKGRRKELLREEVHELLSKALGVKSIHSEYGMTELLSQGYSTGEGIFTPGRTMQILLRDVNDPFCVYPTQTSKRGGINVIDLGNVDSCCFIETKDLGAYDTNGRFSVLGRFDNSDIRGCNLMIA